MTPVDAPPIGRASSAYAGQKVTKLLDAPLRGAGEGPAEMILVSGTAGVGKTTLIEEFSDRANCCLRRLSFPTL